MKHAENYRQAKSVLENPFEYDERDIIRARAYCDAYLEGFSASKKEVEEEFDPIESEIEGAVREFNLYDIVEFQRQHQVDVARGEDFQYYCYIDGAVYATSLTFIHALVYGIIIYKKHYGKDNTNI